MKTHKKAVITEKRVNLKTCKVLKRTEVGHEESALQGQKLPLTPNAGQLVTLETFLGALWVLAHLTF